MRTLDRYFSITARGSSVRQEVRGGLVTFFAMAYIVVLNPLIIGTAPDKQHHFLGIPTVAAVTALVAAVMTIAMGVIGRYPYGLATGLGLNAFLAVNVASKMSWPDAMGLVLWEGIVIVALVLTGFRSAVLRAIPPQLRTAIGVGIGLFITFIGFVDSGIVRLSCGCARLCCRQRSEPNFGVVGRRRDFPDAFAWFWGTAPRRFRIWPVCSSGSATGCRDLSRSG